MLVSNQLYAISLIKNVKKYDLTPKPYSGGCDGDPFHVDRSQVRLGKIDNRGVYSIFEEYIHRPPSPVRLLAQVSWGELAEKYGDPANEQVFHVTDLVGRKWAAAYLKEHSQKL